MIWAWLWVTNWFKWEYADQALYESWYKLAQDIAWNWDFTIEMLLGSIKSGTENRKTREDNYLKINFPEINHKTR